MPVVVGSQFGSQDPGKQRRCSNGQGPRASPMRDGADRHRRHHGPWLVPVAVPSRRAGWLIAGWASPAGPGAGAFTRGSHRGAGGVAARVGLPLTASPGCAGSGGAARAGSAARAGWGSHQRSAGDGCSQPARRWQHRLCAGSDRCRPQRWAEYAACPAWRAFAVVARLMAVVWLTASQGLAPPVAIPVLCSLRRMRRLRRSPRPSPGKTRQDKARQGKARQGKARQEILSLPRAVAGRAGAPLAGPVVGRPGDLPAQRVGTATTVVARRASGPRPCWRAAWPCSPAPR